jgi:outer membrane protein OmpA-like peptidoglycan-associated protein
MNFCSSAERLAYEPRFSCEIGNYSVLEKPNLYIFITFEKKHPECVMSKLNVTSLTREVLPAFLALTLAACQTIDPYTGQQKTSNATMGTAIGAASGAVIGAIAGGDRKAAAIGAGVGALAGAGVGHYMDQQEARLRAQLQGTGVSVTRQGDQIILNMPGNVTFASNQADIRSDFYPVLNSVGLVLEEFEKTLVEVVGHTDSTGSDAINQPLSERRAASVSAYLETRGVIPQRLATFGVGSRYPIADNDTAAGRALNRRVEITLQPLTN